MTLFPCVMIGDSLAVGVGQARPECETVAQVGITSERYLSSLMPPGRTMAETAVISLGVNDGESADTLSNLRDVRARIVGRQVYWLLPGIKEHVREMIRTVAAENGDRLIDTRPHVGRDHLHPNGAGYQLIAARTYGDEGDGEEVALDAPRAERTYADREPDVRRPLRAYSTPSERIRRLRALRRAEGPYRVAGRSLGGRHSERRTHYAAERGPEHVRGHREERGVVRVSAMIRGRGSVAHEPVQATGVSCVVGRTCVARGHSGSSGRPRG